MIEGLINQQICQNSAMVESVAEIHPGDWFIYLLRNSQEGGIAKFHFHHWAEMNVISLILTGGYIQFQTEIECYDLETPKM